MCETPLDFWWARGSTRKTMSPIYLLREPVTMKNCLLLHIPYESSVHDGTVLSGAQPRKSKGL